LGACHIELVGDPLAPIFCREFVKGRNETHLDQALFRVPCNASVNTPFGPFLLTKMSVSVAQILLNAFRPPSSISWIYILIGTPLGDSSFCQFSIGGMLIQVKLFDTKETGFPELAGILLL
jgi:hypothetical protein